MLHVMSGKCSVCEWDGLLGPHDSKWGLTVVHCLGSMGLVISMASNTILFHLLFLVPLPFSLKDKC